ncbi:Co-chaperone protein DjlA [Rhodanobacter lindaniclasticus]
MSFTYTIWFGIFGLLIGHAPGAVVGAVLGFIFDNLRHSQRRQATPEAGGFVGPLFTLLGAVAKSDGRVSEAEIAVAERLMTRMGLTAEQRAQAVASFNAGKQPEFDVTRTIAELRNWVGLRRDHAFPVLDVVIEDGAVRRQPRAGENVDPAPARLRVACQRHGVDGADGDEGLRLERRRRRFAPALRQ